MSRATSSEFAIPSRSLPFVPRADTSSGWASSSRGELVAVVRLDGAVGEDERRRRLVALAQRLHVPAQPSPGRKAVALGEVAARLGLVTPFTVAIPYGAALVVLDVGMERLLSAEPLDVALSLGQLAKPCWRASSSWASASLIGRPAASPARTQLLRLLAELLEVQRCVMTGSFPSGPSSACPGGKKLVGHARTWGGLGPFRGLDAAPAAPGILGHHSQSFGDRPSGGVGLHAIGISIPFDILTAG